MGALLAVNSLFRLIRTTVAILGSARMVHRDNRQTEIVVPHHTMSLKYKASVNPPCDPSVNSPLN